MNITWNFAYNLKQNFEFSDKKLPVNSIEREKSVNEKIQSNTSELYITSTYGKCSGLGNQMFRFASLYGIGKKLNRRPFFDQRKKCQMDYMKEIKETFPSFYQYVKIKIPNPNETTNTKFAMNCCQYEDPENLKNFTSKYLILQGNYLQSYKFFNEYEQEVKDFFMFQQSLSKHVEQIAEQTFKKDNSHKLCIHIRRGDFETHNLSESKEDFILPSIKYVQNYLYINVTNISLLFIGNDHKFVQQLMKKLHVQKFKNMYTPKFKSRSEDLCFGVNYCDSIILSASASTFGWWIGYLKKNPGSVFYNSHITVHETDPKTIYDYDQFPIDWIMLSRNKTTGEVYHETRWFLDRKNKN